VYINVNIISCEREILRTNIYIYNIFVSIYWYSFNILQPVYNTCSPVLYHKITRSVVIYDGCTYKDYYTYLVLLLLLSSLLWSGG
jgi:hypothetical protein